MSSVDEMNAERTNVLPASLAPRGLSRAQAAAYVGVSPGLFDAMVEDGRMPRPRHANARRIWDRIQLDDAFACLPTDGAPDVENPWDEVLKR